MAAEIQQVQNDIIALQDKCNKLEQDHKAVQDRVVALENRVRNKQITG